MVLVVVVSRASGAKAEGNLESLDRSRSHVDVRERKQVNVRILVWTFYLLR